MITFFSDDDDDIIWLDSSAPSRSSTQPSFSTATSTTTTAPKRKLSTSSQPKLHQHSALTHRPPTSTSSIVQQTPPVSQDPRDAMLWVDKYAPTSQDSLKKSVRQAKLNEIKDWLTKALTSDFKQNILLLSGPAGCGKTTTIKVLARELDAEIVEWECPVSHKNTVDYNTGLDSRPDSVLSQFKDFVFRSQRYNTLSFSCPSSNIVSKPNLSRKNSNNQDFDLFEEYTFESSPISTRRLPSLVNPHAEMQEAISSKKIILIDDIPAMFYMPKFLPEFHSILAEMRTRSKYPVVITALDDRSNFSRLFPPFLLQELSIQHIKLNPITNASMSFVLSSILTSERSMLSTNVVREVAEHSVGDLRNAIHALQLMSASPSLPVSKENGECLKSSNGRKRRKGAVPSSSSLSQPMPSSSSHLLTLDSKTSSVNNSSKTLHSNHNAPLQGAAFLREGYLLLFHSVARILRNRRDETLPRASLSLPPYLAQHDRSPSLVDVQDTIMQAHSSHDSLISFLHENYARSFSSFDDLVAAAGHLSDADLISDWKHEEIGLIGCHVAACGLLHAHQTEEQGRWNPLVKPLAFDASKQQEKRMLELRALLEGCPRESDFTEVIPFQSKMTKLGQRNIQNALSLVGSSLRPQQLKENEGFDLESDFDNEDFEDKATLSAASSLPLVNKDGFLVPSSTLRPTLLTPPLSQTKRFTSSSFSSSPSPSSSYHGSSIKPSTTTSKLVVLDDIQDFSDEES